MVLRFAGTLEEPFLPDSLVVDKDGYLYHPVTTLRTNPPPTRRRQRETSTSDESSEAPVEPSTAADFPKQYGLVGASVGFKLGFEFICEEKDSEGNYVIEWEGARTPVPLRETTQIHQ